MATVLDCFSKKVVGYAMAEHMRTELVTDALGMAARNGHIRKGVTIFTATEERNTRPLNSRPTRTSSASSARSVAPGFVTTMLGRSRGTAP